MSNLSGKDWWKKNQSNYPNSRDVNDLHSDFVDKVQKFISILRAGGAIVNVSSTKRNAIRAYLMHYSWCIANNEISPSDVPKMKGVDINWDHGNNDLSVSAAQEMVELFNLAYKPSLTSNHIKGLAIDMNISWKGDLFIGPLPNNEYRGILDGPKNGVNNRELHEVGELFEVYKMKKDPPHWSYNGK
jgi:hypothetical protein